MNGSEGLTRIAKVLKYISYVLLAFGFYTIINDGTNGAAIMGIIIFIIPAVLLFAIAWIIDGFAKKK